MLAQAILSSIVLLLVVVLVLAGVLECWVGRPLRFDRRRHTTPPLQYSRFENEDEDEPFVRSAGLYPH